MLCVAYSEQKSWSRDFRVPSLGLSKRTCLDKLASSRNPSGVVAVLRLGGHYASTRVHSMSWLACLTLSLSAVLANKGFRVRLSIKVVAVHHFRFPGPRVATGFDVGIDTISHLCGRPIHSDLPHRSPPVSLLGSCGSNGRSRIIIWLWLFLGWWSKNSDSVLGSCRLLKKQATSWFLHDPYTHITHF
jgi:hypothetical protein